MTDIIVSNTAQLTAALKSAKGGDTILLQSGNYGDVKLNGLNFGSNVTLKSADGNMGAHFSTLKFVNSSNIRVEDVHVDWNSNGGRAVVEIQNSRGIEIVDSEVNGRVDSVYPIEGPLHGIYVFDKSSDIRIENTHVHDVKNGMTFFGIKDIALIENTVDRVGEDGFKFSQVVGGVIANNTGPSTFYPGKGAHADFMQFQGPGSKDLVISGNVFLPQNQFNAQGIFFGGDNDHANIVIENNIIYTGMVRGISLTASGEITVRDNTVVNALNTEHPQSGILVTGVNGAKVTVENNIASFRYGEYDGKNLLIQHTNKNGAYHYDDVFANASSGKGIDLADLVPVKGSAAENMGAHDRLMELLNGETGTTPVRPAPQPEPTPEPEKPAPEAPADLPDSVAFALTGSHAMTRSKGHIELAHDAAFALGAATIALTFNASKVSGSHGIFSKDAHLYSGDGNHITSYIEKGTLYVRFQDGKKDAVFTAKGIKTGVDYDLQMSFGDGKVTALLNGKVIGSQAMNMDWLGNQEYLQIGGNGWGSKTGEAGFVHPFEGTISDVIIAEGVHSPAAMEKLAQAEPAPIAPKPQPTPVEPQPEPSPVEPRPEPAPTPVEPAPDAPANPDLSIFESIVFAQLGVQKFSGNIRDVITVDHAEAMEMNEGTIAFSFAAADISARHSGILSKDASFYEGGGNHFSAWLTGGKNTATLNIRFQDEDSDALFKVKGIQRDKPYDVMANFDENGVSVWVDGKLVGEDDLVMDWNVNEEFLQIGALGWSSATGEADVEHAFSGVIADVLIFDTALTPYDFDMIA